MNYWKLSCYLGSKNPFLLASFLSSFLLIFLFMGFIKSILDLGMCLELYKLSILRFSSKLDDETFPGDMMLGNWSLWGPEEVSKPSFILRPCLYRSWAIFLLRASFNTDCCFEFLKELEVPFETYFWWLVIIFGEWVMLLTLLLFRSLMI
jgi:hypothetical protein